MTGQPHIYLDYNASTPLRPNVIAAMTEAMQHFGNPSSIHKYGRAARALIEDARDTLAAYFEVEPSQVVFTSGGTEANNMVMKAYDKVIVSSIEHESIDRSSPSAMKIPVSANGIVDLNALNSLMEKGCLISLMLANNETGIIQPVSEVASIARKHGAKVHCDAVTAFTKLPFTYKSLGADYISVSSHKIGGPKGCGALIVPFNEKLSSLLHGGGQEKGHRAGTENLLGIVGFAQAVKDSKNDNWPTVEGYRDLLEETITEHHPSAPIYGKGERRLPNTSYIGMPGVETYKQLMAFDLEGFAVSSGSACSSGKVTPSHVLTAMGYEREASEATRISLGWNSTREEVEKFAKAWLTLYERLRHG